MCRFQLGDVEQAVADFDRCVARWKGRARAAPLWQRGIAAQYYRTPGGMTRAPKQFESPRTVNPEDMENAAWHFLCVTRAAGPEAGRKQCSGPSGGQGRLIPRSGTTRAWR